MRGERDVVDPSQAGPGPWLTVPAPRSVLCSLLWNPFSISPVYLWQHSLHTQELLYLGFWKLTTSPLLMARSGRFWEGWLGGYQLLPSLEGGARLFSSVLLCLFFFSFKKKKTITDCDISLWWDWWTSEKCWLVSGLPAEKFQDRSVYMWCSPFATWGRWEVGWEAGASHVLGLKTVGFNFLFCPIFFFFFFGGLGGS